MKKKFDLNLVKPYVLPVLMGIFTTIGLVEDKKREKKIEELNAKLDSLTETEEA